METHADRVLAMLYDRGAGFCAADELAAACGIGRAALEAAIETLRRGGQAVDRVPAQGLRLVRPVRPSAHLIARDLGTQRVGRNILCFDEVDSTNDVAMASARQGGADGLVVLAEFQRRGRGRRGRTWHSPPGENLLLSVLLLDTDGALPHDAVTVAAGLAVAEAVEANCGVPCGLKWPNDVLVDGAKLAGVLVEARRDAARPCLVIGVGVNVNAAPAAGEVDAAATSLAGYLGGPVERTEVARGVLRRLDAWVGRVAAGALEDLHDGWVERCAMINRRVTVECGAERHVGRVLDVRPLEGLILCRDNGTQVHLPAARSSVVG